MRVILLLTWMAMPLAAQKEHGFDNKKSSGQPYLTPAESAARMTVPPEFEVKLFAGEPLVVNPIAFTIDEKGRVWVVECFEYPSRTPAGKMPRDRIVILEDTDGDGVCDKRTVFAEGKDFPERFDMASGIEVGNGGVYLGAPPYLWFIENKNDKPGKFEKLLSGFGSQDTHETLNTFQWGPDGWLYGLHGIYTQSNVKPLDGPELRVNAAVWRYHPKTKKFEIYAEGTSNPWGMDWRSSDGQFILACCVIPHLYHIVPGGVYQRQSGPNQNPFAYDPIKEISDHTFHKESGWAHAGLLSLDVPHMPEKYRNSVIFGSIHGCSLKQNILKPSGSTYIASRSEDFLVSGDKNVRPINLRWGPNGDIYMIDWHDQNPCHQAATDSWDYERGRVYRIQLKGAKLFPAKDLGTADVSQLVQYALTGSTPWHRRTAVRLLAERNVSDLDRLVPNPDLELTDEQQLRNDMMANSFGMTRSAYMVPGSEALKAFRIRRYSEILPVRAILTPYAHMPELGTSAVIRRELACMVIRMPQRSTTCDLIHELCKHPQDLQDPLLSKLLWTAYVAYLSVEKTSIDDELTWLADKSVAMNSYMLPRAMRWLAESNLPRALSFVAANTDETIRERALPGLITALAGRVMPAPDEWKKLRPELVASPNANIRNAAAALSIAFRDPEAIKAALASAQNASKPAAERVDGVRQLALLKPANGAKTLVALVNDDVSLPVRVEAARALAGFKDVSLSGFTWAKAPRELQSELIGTLAARKETAVELLKAVQAKTVDRTLLTDSVITRMQAFKDPALSNLIDEAWGRTRATPADLLKQIDAMRLELESGPGSFANGKSVFTNQCAKCHKFENAGSDVGPPLDGAGRDIEYLLANVLDPNRVVGAPYFVRQAVTADGQVVQGLLAEEDEKFITLKLENNALKKLAKSELEGPVKILERSIMPEGLTAGMKPQEFRDLVKYLMAHPFAGAATVNGRKTAIPVGGLLPLPEAKDAITIEVRFTAAAEMKTKLLVGSANTFEASMDGKMIGTGKGTQRKLAMDSESLEVTIPAGPHTLRLVMQSKWAAKGIYLRLLDPDRRISYEE